MNALTSQGWREIGRGQFDTPDCHTVRLQRCDVGAVDVMFAVHSVPRVAASGGGAADASEQWLDLSRFNNGFAPRTFLGAGPFPAALGQSEPIGMQFEWPRLAENRVHYVRVNARYPAGWMPQARTSFLALQCTGLPPVAASRRDLAPTSNSTPNIRPHGAARGFAIAPVPAYRRLPRTGREVADDRRRRSGGAAGDRSAARTAR